MVPVSVNVSARQFNQGKIKDLVADCLARHQIDAALLEIELTESAMMGENIELMAELSAIRTMGVKLLVDDFGTGYSSLSQLQRLDMDVLKVDRAFTSELGMAKEGEVFFKAIVSMAHALGMRVVAEGVETAEQIRILQLLCCDEVQGCFITQPLPHHEIPQLISRHFLFPAFNFLPQTV
jgi:EAL domain-containing protein (putative c-di-GMP-specific phosphodiesterase class I)